MRTTEVLLGRAKVMRSEPTSAEARLWYRLRAGRLNGIKFARQVPIGHYIVDFVARGSKVIIEVDGDTHNHLNRDAERSAWLAARGYRIIRFTNAEVIGNEAAVLDAIAVAVATPPLPGPLPASGAKEKFA